MLLLFLYFVVVVATMNDGNGGVKIMFIGKQGNVLENTFYLRLYGVGHMIKNHSDNERGNPLPPFMLLFPIISNVPFHRLDSRYHELCCNGLMGPLRGIDPMTHCTMNYRARSCLHQ